MKYSQKDIITALTVIQDICGGITTGCDDCPFGDQNGTCMIKQECPDGWILNTSDKVVWRAFY